MVRNNNLLKLVIMGSVCLAHSSTNAEETTIIDTVIVVGNTEAAVETDTVGSIDVISKEEIRYERVDDPVELLNKVPGTYVSRYNQGAVNADISIRGFAGDGLTPHAKLLIDGIPSNYNNGFTELSQLFPINIESIEVFKGTSDPRYGLFNIAGNYNVATRQDIAKEAAFTVGSYNTQELVSYLGFENGNLIHNYSIGYRTNEGYRDHTSLDKLALSASWEYAFSESQSLRLTARHAYYDGDAPGYLSKDKAREEPRLSADYANQDGNDKSTDHVSLHWSQKINNAFKWSLKAYTQDFERERWVRFSDAGSLGNRYDEQTMSGAIINMNWFINNTWQLDFGTDYEQQDVLEQRFATINQTRTRGTNTRDRKYTLDTFGGYVQLHHYPTDSLRWNIALRADQVNGDFTDRNSNTSKKAYDYGTIIQPKFNLLLSATENTDLFLNAGRTFQHLTGGAAYTGGNTNADPSVNNGIELGTKVNISDALIARISYWEQVASDEFGYNVTGDLINVGKTKREGVDIAINGQVNEKLSYWGSYSTVDTKVIKATDAPSIQGNDIFGIPGYTVALGMAYQINPALTLRGNIDSQSGYYVNANNEGGKFGEYTVANVSADYDTGWGALQLQLNNITDEYSEYVYDFSPDATSTIHSPGDGFNASMSVKVDFN